MPSLKYPPRKAIFAPGIRLQDARFSSRVWWLKKWLDSLSSKDLASRFARGKAYAASGQVTRLEIDLNHIEAEVLGARSAPYKVTIDFRSPQGAAREEIVARIKNEPMLLARMMANDLPTEIETFFKTKNYDLFPGGKLGEGLYDMRTACSCPDYANPCKHSFAVLLVLAEEIARNCTLLLNLRGFKMEEFVL